MNDQTQPKINEREISHDFKTQLLQENLSEDPKGKDYIQWLLSQTSFVQNPRNAYLLDAINECNIKKKMNKA